MITAEQIEGLDHTDMIGIQEAAKKLHEATPTALQLLNSYDVSDEENKRQLMRLKIDEATWHLSSQIADLEALKKELRIMKGYQGSDAEKIKSHKFNLLIQEKKLRDESRSR